MKIRQTTFNDLKPIMAIYDYARQFMKEHGNPNQWINGYPSEEYIQQEIADGHSYVCENAPSLLLPEKILPIRLSIMASG